MASGPYYYTTDPNGTKIVTYYPTANILRTKTTYGPAAMKKLQESQQQEQQPQAPTKEEITRQIQAAAARGEVILSPGLIPTGKKYTRYNQGNSTVFASRTVPNARVTIERIPEEQIDKMYAEYATQYAVPISREQYGQMVAERLASGKMTNEFGTPVSALSSQQIDRMYQQYRQSPQTYTQPVMTRAEFSKQVRKQEETQLYYAEHTFKKPPGFFAEIPEAQAIFNREIGEAVQKQERYYTSPEYKKAQKMTEIRQEATRLVDSRTEPQKIAAAFAPSTAKYGLLFESVGKRDFGSPAYFERQRQADIDDMSRMLYQRDVEQKPIGDIFIGGLMDRPGFTIPATTLAGAGMGTVLGAGTTAGRNALAARGLALSARSSTALKVGATAGFTGLTAFETGRFEGGVARSVAAGEMSTAEASGKRFQYYGGLFGGILGGMSGFKSGQKLIEEKYPAQIKTVGMEKVIIESESSFKNPNVRYVGLKSGGQRVILDTRRQVSFLETGLRTSRYRVDENIGQVFRGETTFKRIPLNPKKATTESMFTMSAKEGVKLSPGAELGQENLLSLGKTAKGVTLLTKTKSNLVDFTYTSERFPNIEFREGMFGDMTIYRGSGFRFAESGGARQASGLRSFFSKLGGPFKTAGTKPLLTKQAGAEQLTGQQVFIRDVFYKNPIEETGFLTDVSGTAGTHGGTSPGTGLFNKMFPGRPLLEPPKPVSPFMKAITADAKAFATENPPILSAKVDKPVTLVTGLPKTLTTLSSAAALGKKTSEWPAERVRTSTPVLSRSATLPRLIFSTDTKLKTTPSAKLRTFLSGATRTTPALNLKQNIDTRLQPRIVPRTYLEHQAPARPTVRLSPLLTGLPGAGSSIAGRGQLINWGGSLAMGGFGLRDRRPRKRMRYSYFPDPVSIQSSLHLYGKATPVKPGTKYEKYVRSNMGIEVPTVELLRARLRGKL